MLSGQEGQLKKQGSRSLPGHLGKDPTLFRQAGKPGYRGALCLCKQHSSVFTQECFNLFHKKNKRPDFKKNKLESNQPLCCTHDGLLLMAPQVPHCSPGPRRLPLGPHPPLAHQATPDHVRGPWPSAVPTDQPLTRGHGLAGGGHHKATTLQSWGHLDSSVTIAIYLLCDPGQVVSMRTVRKPPQSTATRADGSRRHLLWQPLPPRLAWASLDLWAPVPPPEERGQWA